MPHWSGLVADTAAPFLYTAIAPVPFTLSVVAFLLLAAAMNTFRMSPAWREKPAHVTTFAAVVIAVEQVPYHVVGTALTVPSAAAVMVVPSGFTPPRSDVVAMGRVYCESVTRSALMNRQ